jgi:lipopolysaccharide/colanic/teichoic acid biosynthesis glycosyltransferase
VIGHNNDQIGSSIPYKFPLNSFSYRVWKRLFDLTFAVMGLVIYLPVLLVIALLIKVTSPGPIFYRQERIGVGGKVFSLYKFRTMSINTFNRLSSEDFELTGVIFKIRKDPRITPIGLFLRKSSLDELPQFLNILKGDMSFVGPRPAFKYELCNVDQKELNCRLAVRPGMTGLWQLKMRNCFLDFSKLEEIDNEYCRDWSLWLDFKIICRTIAIVFQRQGSF